MENQNPTERYKEKIISKFKILSDKYHNLSLIFYELSKSLEMESRRRNSIREFKAYIKSLNLDIKKIEEITKDMSNISLNDLKADRLEK